MRSSRYFQLLELVLALAAGLALIVSLYEFFVRDRLLPSYRADFGHIFCSHGTVNLPKDASPNDQTLFLLERYEDLVGLAEFIEERSDEVIYVDIYFFADCLLPASLPLTDEALFGDLPVEELLHWGIAADDVASIGYVDWVSDDAPAQGFKANLLADGLALYQDRSNSFLYRASVHYRKQISNLTSSSTADTSQITIQWDEESFTPSALARGGIWPGPDGTFGTRYMTGAFEVVRDPSGIGTLFALVPATFSETRESKRRCTQKVLDATSFVGRVISYVSSCMFS